jgi:hypothetical protein
MGMKGIKLLSLLFVAALFVQNAAATMLPYSSHYQGRSYFGDAGVTGHIDFAVYDKEGPNGNEWTDATGFAAPGDGRYIYAYQIFNNTDSADAVKFFTIMGVDEHKLIGIETMNTQFVPEGVAPTDYYTNPDKTEATWEFAGGILVADKYSWFLIFSSTHDWTEGRYDMSPPGGDIVPAPNPEPCTLALLGLGSAMLFAKRRNFCRQGGLRR